MSGAVAGLIASVKSGSAPEPTNLVLNPSFTTNIVGWTDGYGNAERNTSFFRSAPASLYSYFDGDNLPLATYNRSSAVSLSEAYSFSAWILNSATRNFRIELTLGGIYYFTDVSVPASASWQYIKLENKVAGATGNLVVSVLPFIEDSFYIDDVSLVLGATALP